jgi:hypothetical protein
VAQGYLGVGRKQRGEIDMVSKKPKYLKEVSETINEALSFISPDEMLNELLETKRLEYEVEWETLFSLFRRFCQDNGKHLRTGNHTGSIIDYDPSKAATKDELYFLAFALNEYICTMKEEEYRKFLTKDFLQEMQTVVGVVNNLTKKKTKKFTPTAPQSPSPSRCSKP